MKTLTKFTLATLAVGSISLSAAFADDLKLVQRPNAHGQTYFAYEPAATTTIALFHGDRSIGAVVGSMEGRAELNAVPQSNAHGQTISLYRSAQ